MAQRAMIGVRVVAYAKLVEEGCCSRSRARAIDNSKDERASSDRHPGDEMLEGDRLKRDIELCKPDGGRCDHRHSAMILIGYIVGPRPRPNGTSTLQQLQTRRAQSPKRNVFRIFMTRLSEAEDVQSCVKPALPDNVHFVGKRMDIERSTSKLTNLLTSMSMQSRLYKMVPEGCR